MENKEAFDKVFANIPLSERRMPIYVDQEYGPMSWYVVNLEVLAMTIVGIRALEFLKKNNII